MLNKIIKTILLVLIVFFIFSSSASAAELAQNTVTIKARPQTPRPGQTVYVEVTSAPTIVDLRRSEITWLINGKVVEKGIGKDRIQIKAGAVGSNYNVSALIKTAEGNFITKNISVISEEITIIWEADTYTPPFYKGKALDTQGSTVKLVAFPDVVDKSGKRIPTKDLIYEWSVDGTFRKALSGIGENIYTIKSETVPITTRVNLTVSSFDKEIKAKTTTNLRISDPKVVLYESNPLLGILFNRALGEKTKIENNEISVVPVPFFFSTKNRTSQLLSYTWFVGDKIINTPTETGGFITFARPTEETGRSSVSLLLNNLGNAHQKVKKDLSFDF